jgi:hypothetical protein
MSKMAYVVMQMVAGRKYSLSQLRALQLSRPILESTDLYLFVLYLMKLLQ